jgi:hypothetical protein
MLIFVALATSSSAQITREKADEIVLEYIQNEVTPPYLLYVNVNTPTAEGIAITTYQEETMKVKYACWAYYLNENPNVSDPTQHRYLFVKADDGNLLEVITANDLGADVSTDWIPLNNTGLIDLRENRIVVYPNPTRGELRVESGEWRVESVEVFDVFGKSYGLTVLPSYGLDISHLPTGTYFLRITTETGVVTQKVIKN